MTNMEVIDEIKLELTGYLLEMEIDDTQIEAIIRKVLRELERYIDETSMITVPFASCIDYSTSTDFKNKVSSIVKVYRTEGYGESYSSSGSTDPLYMQQWMLFSNGGTMYNLNDYCLNYAAWQTLLKIKSTISTDMAFKEDKHNSKLYINCALDKPATVTIEYIPKLTSAEDIKDEYWQDILVKLTLAYTKIVLGRIRTRFGLSNALWSQDGEKLLEEGNAEKKELEEVLRTNSNLIFGID